MSVMTTTSAADEGVGVLPPHLGVRLKRLGWKATTTRCRAVAAVAGRGDDGGDLRRQVAVVVDERRAAVDAADVEAAATPPKRAEGLAAVVERARRGRGPWRSPRSR